MDKRLPFFILLIMALAFTPLRGSAPRAQTTTTTAQTQAKPDMTRKASAFSGLPVIGEFQAPPEAEANRVHRQVREQKYSATHDPGRIEDPGRLVGGQEEHTAFIFIDTVTVGKPIDPPGIPITGINTIVIGTVVSGKCFLAADHTHVYTDYSVKIDQVLKQDQTANLNAGDVVVAAREGGAIRFPSGHVTSILVAGRGLPEIGSQYVFFLWKPIPEFPEYEMVPESAGYQLKNGRVYPLDDMNSQYVGVEAPIFLDEVRKAIAASPGGVRQ